MMSKNHNLGSALGSVLLGSYYMAIGEYKQHGTVREGLTQLCYGGRMYVRDRDFDVYRKSKNIFLKIEKLNFLYFKKIGNM